MGFSGLYLFRRFYPKQQVSFLRALAVLFEGEDSFLLDGSPFFVEGFPAIECCLVAVREDPEMGLKRGPVAGFAQIDTGREISSDDVPNKIDTRGNVFYCFCEEFLGHFYRVGGVFPKAKGFPFPRVAFRDDPSSYRDFGAQRALLDFIKTGS